MSARWSPKLLVALLILSTEQAKAKDITEMPLNSVVENVVTIGKKQVPLLKGAWEVVRSSSNISMTVGSPLGGALLARKVGDKYTGGIYIRTNMEMVSHGWKRHRTICDRDNVHFNVSDRNYNHETADCWQVNHFVNTYSTKGGEFYQGLKDWMRETFSTSSVLTLQYFRNDVNDYLNIYYIFDPTNYGFPVLLEVSWASSDWHRYAVQGDPKRERFIAAAKALGEKLHALIRQGFRNKLDAYVADLDLEFSD